MLNKQRQAMIEGIGPLQIIYKLPHDEVLFSTNCNAIRRRVVSYTHQNLQFIDTSNLSFIIADCSPKLLLCSGEVFLAPWPYVHLPMASVLPL